MRINFPLPIIEIEDLLHTFLYNLMLSLKVFQGNIEESALRLQKFS